MNEKTEDKLFDGVAEKDFTTALTGVAALDILDGAKGEEAMLLLGNRKTRRAMRRRLMGEGYGRYRAQLRSLKKG